MPLLLVLRHEQQGCAVGMLTLACCWVLTTAIAILSKGKEN